MYPTLVMMIVTMQDSVLAADSDNLPSTASSFRFAKPSHDVGSGFSRESSPPGLRGARSTDTCVLGTTKSARSGRGDEVVGDDLSVRAQREREHRDGSVRAEHLRKHRKER